MIPWCRIILQLPQLNPTKEYTMDVLRKKDRQFIHHLITTVIIYPQLNKVQYKKDKCSNNKIYSCKHPNNNNQYKNSCRSEKKIYLLPAPYPLTLISYSLVCVYVVYFLFAQFSCCELFILFLFYSPSFLYCELFILFYSPSFFIANYLSYYFDHFFAAFLALVNTAISSRFVTPSSRFDTTSLM